MTGVDEMDFFFFFLTIFGRLVGWLVGWWLADRLGMS